MLISLRRCTLLFANHIRQVSSRPGPTNIMWENKHNKIYMLRKGKIFRVFLTLIPPLFFSSLKCCLLFTSPAYIQVLFRLDNFMKANNMNLDQTAPKGAVWSGSSLQYRLPKIISRLEEQMKKPLHMIVVLTVIDLTLLLLMDFPKHIDTIRMR